MRILFYLPVVTPWWFANIVEPLIRRVASDAEIFVLAPQPWRGTGIGPDEVARCHDLREIRWCIVDSEDHPSLRTEPAARAELCAFVAGLEPDYIFCRSADIDTVRAFPGRPRFIMEGGLAPFALPPHWIMLQDAPLDHALVPELAPADRARLDAWIAPAWSRLQDRHAGDPAGRSSLLESCGLDPERPFLLLPLEYEHEENFFPIHRVGPRQGHRLVAELAEAVGEDFSLAVTDHPLNSLYVDRTELYATISALGPKVRLMPSEPDGIPATVALAPYAEGIITGDSKAYALAGFFGRPILRRTRFATGAWLQAYSELRPFLADLRAGTARRPSPDEARTAFAFHLACAAFDPQDEALDLERLARRVDRPLDPRAWPAAMARVEQAMPELFA